MVKMHMDDYHDGEDGDCRWTIWVGACSGMVL